MDMIENILIAFKELVETTKSYKIMGIRLVMISSLTFLMVGTSVILNYSEEIVKLLSSISFTRTNSQDGLTIKSILAIQSTLSSVRLPPGYILGIESIKATGAREIFWVSNERTFEELKKLDVNLINRNPKRLQYAKGYAYLVGSCNLAPGLDKVYKYNYYVCPIRSNSQTVGIVWVLYDVNLANSEDGLDVSSELVPILLELRDALEKENGLN